MLAEVLLQTVAVVVNTLEVVAVLEVDRDSIAVGVVELVLLFRHCYV